MITIGMVLYNEEKHIPLVQKNLSVLTKSPLFTVVIINNASTDNTGEMLASLATQFPIKIHHRAENNLGAARQEVVSLAQTEWMGFIDGDCVVNEQWVSLALQKITEITPDVSAFGGPWYPAGNYKNHFDALFASPMGHFSLPQFSFENDEAFVAHIPTANIIYRRSDVIAAGGFHSDYQFVGEDLDLSCRLRKNGKKLLMVAQMPIDHYLPERLHLWSKKIFTYGRGRVQVAYSNKKFIDRILFLPIFFLVTMITSVALGHVWLLVLYAVVVAVVAILSSKKSTPTMVWALIVCTHFSYALGMAYEWCVVYLPFGATKMRADLPPKIVLAVEKTAMLGESYFEETKNT